MSSWPWRSSGLLHDVAEADLEMTPLCKGLHSPNPVQSPERDELFFASSSPRCCVVGPPYLQCPCCSVTKSCLTLCDLVDSAYQASLFFAVSQSLLKFMSIESVMPSNHCILCCPLLLLPSIFPNIWVFSSESALHIRWLKYWSFSFSISPSSEYSGLIFFGIYWLDLLAVQGTLKSLLQHHNLKASVLWCSAFFVVQLSQPYMTTGKAIALTRWTFAGKMMSLLFLIETT